MIAIEKKKDYYTLISQKAVTGLNLAERGLYLYMKSQSESYDFHVGVMARESGCSIYQIRKVLKSLIAKGLIQRIQDRVKGFINYVYKVLEKRGEIRDDAKYLCSKREEKKETTELKVVEKIQVTAEKVEQKEWRLLFEGREDLVNKFIDNRRKHLQKCDYYKDNSKAVTDIIVDTHIQRKMDEDNTKMPQLIAEFIKSESDKKVTVENVKVAKEYALTETQKLKNEIGDKILLEQKELSKARLPELWERLAKSTSFSSIIDREESEKIIKPELDAIAKKYETEYKSLTGKNLNE